MVRVRIKISAARMERDEEFIDALFRV